MSPANIAVKTVGLPQSTALAGTSHTRYHFYHFVSWRSLARPPKHHYLSSSQCSYSLKPGTNLSHLDGNLMSLIRPTTEADADLHPIRHSNSIKYSDRFVRSTKSTESFSFDRGTSWATAILIRNAIWHANLSYRPMPFRALRSERFSRQGFAWIAHFEAVKVVFHLRPAAMNTWLDYCSRIQTVSGYHQMVWMTSPQAKSS